MRKFSNAICGIMLMSAWAVPLQVEAQEHTDQQGLTYSVYRVDDNYSAVIVGVSESATNITIPNTITCQYDDHTVTAKVEQIGESVFCDHAALKSVKFNDNIEYYNNGFRNCVSLETVENLPLDWDNKLQDEYFYNCPKLKVGDFSWIRGNLEKIGRNCFSLPELTFGGEITVPGTVIEIDESFKNRVFDKATFLPSIEGSGLYSDIAAKILYLERNVSANNDDYNSYVEEIYNLENDISSIDNLDDYWNPFTNLKKLVARHLNSENGCYIRELPNLEYIDLSGSKIFGLEITDLPKLETLLLPDVIDNGLTLVNLPLKDMKFDVQVKAMIRVENVAAQKIDLSSITVDSDPENSIQEVKIAFCPNVAEIKFPDNCAGEIEYYECPALKDVYVGDKITSIRSNDNGIHDVVYAGTADQWCEIEHDCESINNIGNGEDISSFDWIDKLWIGHKSKMTVLTDLVVNSATKITSGAFAKYKRLVSVSAGPSVKTIESAAFHNCPALKTITLNCDSIADMAFFKAKALSSLTLGDNLKVIVATAFDGCGGDDTKVNYLGTPDQWARINFTTVLGTYSHILLYSTISPTAIAKGGFYFNGKLAENINFTTSLNSIPETAFQGLKNLKSVTFFGHYPRTIGYSAFSDCPELTTVSLAAYQNSKIRNVTEQLVDLDDYAFHNDSKLSEIGFLPYLVSVGEKALDGTKWFETQAEGCVYAGNVLLKYKGTIPDNTVLTVKEGTLSIAKSALVNQKGLTGIEFPSTLVSILDDAINWCDNLKGTLRYPGSLVVCNSYVRSEGVTSVVFEDNTVEGERITTCQAVDLPNLKELYVGKSFDCTNYYAEYNVKTLTFGPKFDYLCKDFFGYSSMENLKIIKVLRQTPPEVHTQEGWVWDIESDERKWGIVTPLQNLDKKAIKLVVPAGTADAYRMAEGWKDFLNIEEASGAGVDNAAMPDKVIIGYYNAEGIFSSEPHSGFNIVVYSNGSRAKSYIR